MKSLKKRFEGRELEILGYINEHGGNKYGYTAMEHFGAKDYIAWRRFADEIAQEFNFQFAPREVSYIADCFKSPDVQYMAECAGEMALIKKVARLELEIKRKRERIEQLKRDIAEAEEAVNYEPEGIRVLI